MMEHGKLVSFKLITFDEHVTCVIIAIASCYMSVWKRTKVVIMKGNKDFKKS